ncbi:MAG TPA: hypothetical protein VFZ24_17635 [Longimicrobiales bacterium]
MPRRLHAVLNGRRAGIALVMALLLLVVIDCIVLGSLHLSLQEHRIGSNRAIALGLRLEAESAARRALGQWSALLDSMTPALSRRIVVAGAAAPHTHVEIERLSDHLFMIDAVAREPAPRVGRAAARLLVHPPPLPPGLDPAASPLSAAGPVLVAPTAVVSATANPACPAGVAVHSIRARQLHDITIAAGALLDAPAGLLTSHDLTASFDRIAALARPAFVTHADTIITSSTTGLIIARGNLVLTGGAVFTGLLIVRGSVTLDPGTAVHGAVHAVGGATLHGTVQRDPCAVGAAVAAAALDRPRPAGPRAWVAVF